MSTVVVVRKKGFTAIAADTLTKFGYLKESADYLRNHDKIIKLGNNHFGVAGSMTNGFCIRDYFSDAKVKADFSNVDAIFRTWNRFHRSLKEDYFIKPDEHDDDSYESSRMEVVLANPTGIFNISAYRSVQEYEKFYANGSGYEFAMGAMFAVYQNEKLSAMDIAQIGVQAAAEFDDATGLPIISHSIRLKV